MEKRSVKFCCIFLTEVLAVTFFRSVLKHVSLFNSVNLQMLI